MLWLTLGASDSIVRVFRCRKRTARWVEGCTVAMGLGGREHVHESAQVQVRNVAQKLNSLVEE